jgi:hypothetical protein
MSWNTGSENTFAPMTGSGSYFFTAYNNEGCISLSDTLNVTMGDIPPTPVITVTGTTLSTDPYPDLQWYENGVAMPGETGTSIVITLPNQNNYTVVATGTTGCEAESVPYNASAGIEDGKTIVFTVWPNPSSGILHIQSEQAIEELALFDLSGNLVLQVSSPEATIDLKTVSFGTYLLRLRSESATGWMKIVRN